MQSRLLIKELEEAGWTLDRVTGSHHIFRHRYNPCTIPVPSEKGFAVGTVKSIRRRAGLYTRQPATREIHNAISDLHRMG